MIVLRDKENFEVHVMNDSSEFKDFCKQLSTEQRQLIISSAREQEIIWKEHKMFKVNWMRCAMAINNSLKRGSSITFLFAPTFDDNSSNSNNIKKTSRNKKPTTIIDQMNKLAEKLGKDFKEEQGSLIFGKGFKTTTNQYGYQDAIKGHIKMVSIPLEKKKENSLIKLESSYYDKEKIKELKGWWNGTDKKWYIPFNQILKAIKLFENIEISNEISEAVLSVINNIDIDKLDEESLKYKKDIYKFKMPNGMNKSLTLFLHQKTAVEFALNNKRVTLGLAVGLGKTVISITAAKELLNSDKIKRVLVIAPASVKYNWKDEIERFGNEKAKVLDSSDLRKKDSELHWKEAENSSFIVVNYDMLRKSQIVDRLKTLCGEFVIADEAHKLKNYRALQTKSFKENWGKTSEYILFLTATPFPNGSPNEVFTMLSHLSDKVGNWYEFGSKYVDFEQVSTPMGVIDKPLGLINFRELKEQMKDVVLVRTHHSPDVQAALPKDRHISYNLDMNNEQKKLYKAFLNDQKSEIEELFNKGQRLNILQLLIRLEQIALDPDLTKPEDKVDLTKLYPKEEWAFETIIQHLENKENRGVVLFCDKILPLRKMKKVLTDNNVRASIISGQTDTEERFNITEKFNNGLLDVVLCSSAAEEGINLQKGAHTMIHLDIPYVPKTITQREGRILRTGQPSSFTLFHTPIMKNTVEFKKLGKIESKVQVIEKLLGKGSSGSAREVLNGEDASGWSLEELKELLMG